MNTVVGARENLPLLVQSRLSPTDAPRMAQDRLIHQWLPLRAGRAAVAWAPVWVPLVLIWQLTEGGLKPALKEQERLHAEEPAVLERNDRTASEYELLTAQRAAWDDSVFRERVRRSNARAEQEKHGDAE
jgi:hypothetical protein